MQYQSTEFVVDNYPTDEKDTYDETLKTFVMQGVHPYEQIDVSYLPQEESMSSSNVCITTIDGNPENGAPSFLKCLHDQSVREGDEVLFEVIVSGKRNIVPKILLLNFLLYLHF